MKSKNKGTCIEKNIIDYINEHKYIHKMNENMQKFISHLFNFNLSKHEIKAYKFAENYKPDIIITANGYSKYISIKSGSNNSVHQEHLYSFLNLLRDNNLPEHVIQNIRKFHFNDGSINGSGNKRNNAANFQEKHPTIINEINTNLNQKDIQNMLIDRLLFKGEYYNLPTVDYIYYGDTQNGLWANRDEIISFLCAESIYSSSIHVSKLYYQSLHRNLKYDKYYEYRRYYIQFKWYSLKEDLKYITKKR